MKCCVFFSVVLTAAASTAMSGANAMAMAMASDTALQKCRLLAEASARLACYDAIALTPPAAAQSSAAKVTAPANFATTTPTSPSSSPSASPGANDTAADFGLPNVMRAAQLEKIDSTIAGHFERWQNGSRITLANGQVWLVIDDSRGVCNCDNPKVVVSRGSFGTFFLEIEGKGNAPRVRRVK